MRKRSKDTTEPQISLEDGYDTELDENPIADIENDDDEEEGYTGGMPRTLLDLGLGKSSEEKLDDYWRDQDVDGSEEGPGVEVPSEPERPSKGGPLAKKEKKAVIFTAVSAIVIAILKALTELEMLPPFIARILDAIGLFSS